MLVLVLQFFFLQTNSFLVPIAVELNFGSKNVLILRNSCSLPCKLALAVGLEVSS